MDAERSLLGKIIASQQLDELIALEVQPTHFVDDECRAVYETMLKHMSKYGQPPTAHAMRDYHPEFPVVVTQENTDYLLDRFLMQVKRRTAIDLYRDFGDACDDPERQGDLEVIAMEMASKLMDLVPKPRVGRYSEAEGRIEDYFKRLEAGEPPGMFMGFPELDKHTVGIQPHEFIVFAGWQNSGKSAIMQRVAWQFYEEEAKTPLYISLEMSKEECFGRWDSMATQMEHRALRALEVHKDDDSMAKWRAAAKRAHDFRAERDIIVIDDIGSCTPDRVLVETRRYEPDVVFVDYLELMDAPRRGDQSEWQMINEIGRTLKRNARVKINGKNIPVIVACQTNADDGGKGATLDNISYKSTGKHADMVFGIKRTEDMEREYMMELTALKNRNGKRGMVQQLSFKPETMYINPLNAKDVYRGRDERDQARENPRAAAQIARSPIRRRPLPA
jgi:replicative DNA helicase